MSSGTRRQRFFCPKCGQLLAYVRPELLIARRLVVDFSKIRRAERHNGEVVIVCQCGETITVKWAAIQF